MGTLSIQLRIPSSGATGELLAWQLASHSSLQGSAHQPPCRHSATAVLQMAAAAPALAAPAAPTASGKPADNTDLPKALISTIIRNKLNPLLQVEDSSGQKVNLNKDALLAFAESAKIFVSYLTATANDICHEAKRQIISADDVLRALEDMDMGELVPGLKADLDAFRDDSREKNAKKAERNKKRKQDELEAVIQGDSQPSADLAHQGSGQPQQPVAPPAPGPNLPTHMLQFQIPMPHAQQAAAAPGAAYQPQQAQQASQTQGQASLPPAAVYTPAQHPLAAGQYALPAAGQAAWPQQPSAFVHFPGPQQALQQAFQAPVQHAPHHLPLQQPQQVQSVSQPGHAPSQQQPQQMPAQLAHAPHSQAHMQAQSVPAPQQPE